MSSPAVPSRNELHASELEYEEEATRAGVTTARIAALVPLILGIGGVIVSLRLDIGTLGAPGAGLWPLIISLFMVAGAALALVKAKQDRDVEAFDKGFLTVVLSVTSLLAYAFLLPLVGFEIPTVLLLVFWIKILGKERWRPALTVAVVATIVTYVLFILLFAVPLPHLF